MRDLGMMVAGLAITCSLIGFTAGKASAGCSGGTAPAKEQSSATFVPAVYHPELASTGFMTVADTRSRKSAIVGLWEFEVRLNGAQNGLPDKALLDWGLATWHDDGTEIQFSASRPPSSGDVCMGVWHENEPDSGNRHRHLRRADDHPGNGCRERCWKQLFRTLLARRVPRLA